MKATWTKVYRAPGYWIDPAREWQRAMKTWSYLLEPGALPTVFSRDLAARSPFCAALDRQPVVSPYHQWETQAPHDLNELESRRVVHAANHSPTTLQQRREFVEQFFGIGPHSLPEALVPYQRELSRELDIQYRRMMESHLADASDYPQLPVPEMTEDEKYRLMDHLQANARLWIQKFTDQKELTLEQKKERREVEHSLGDHLHTVPPIGEDV